MGMDQCVFVWCVLWVDSMKSQFPPAADFPTVTATEFVMDEASTSQIEAMPGVDISQYARKERVGAQARYWGHILATKQEKRSVHE